MTTLTETPAPAAAATAVAAAVPSAADAFPAWMELMQALAAGGVRCWLDSGSLLGMVRNANFNAWEKDIDVGVWAGDLAATIEICRAFAQHRGLDCVELQVRGLYYVVLLEDKEDREPQTTLPIAVHLFHRVGQNAWSPQPHSLAWGQSKYPRHRLREFRSAGRKGWRKVAAFARAHPRYALGLLLNKLRLSPAISRWVKTQARSGWKRGRHPSDGRVAAHLFDYFQWIVPAHFFTDLAPLPGYPAYVLAPRAVDEYLALRYGNWREPVRNWFYLVDDGCIFPMARKRLEELAGAFRDPQVRQPR